MHARPVRLKRQRKQWILFWVEGDDPNESTMKAAVSYISPKIPSSSTLAHLGFDLRPSDLFFLIYIFPFKDGMKI